MCGIAGLLGPTAHTEPLIGPMLTAIEHRGPDDFGIWAGDTCAIGMRRLSIIDIAGGHQPMWSADRRFAIVYNGELYNYRELREELSSAGHVFATDSDTEVLLQFLVTAGFANMGAALNRLRGMFGFAIVDTATNSAIIARDQFGIKPLYYRITETSGSPKLDSFASEIKSLLVDPAVERRVHVPALVNYLSFQFNPLNETFFAGIVALPPGHFMQVDLTTRDFDITQYWQYDFVEPASTDEHITTAAIRNVLEDSVAHHLLADVPVGAFLSGGIDSAITVTLVQEQRLAAGRSPVKTFTIGFAELGELAEAREVAERIGTDHHEIVVSAADYLAALPRIAWMFDQPVADPSAVALYFLAEAAREQVTVVLSGEGADELFGGYRIYQEPMALDRLRTLPAGIGSGTARAALKVRRNFPGRNYLRRVATSLRERYIGNAYIFTPAQTAKLLRHDPGYTHEYPYDQLAASRPGFTELPESRQMQLIDMTYWLRGDILTKADRMTMAHSLELRVPYLDIDVAAVSATVADTLKYRDGTTKWALREAFRGRVPDTTAGRAKLGFPTPLRLWLSADPDAVLAPIRSSAFIAEQMNMDYIEQLVVEHVTGTADHSRRIFVLLMLALWHDAFFTDG